MKKLSLSLDALAVETFSTDAAPAWTGTVKGHVNTQDECNTNAITICTCNNPCTSDAYATIDAVLCAGSVGTACGSEQTIAINTCRPTGWCCRTVDFTGPCCP